MNKVIRKKPNAAGGRNITYPDFSALSKGKLPKKLLMPLKKHAGRDTSGRISIRHRGGGTRRMYRILSDLVQIGEPVSVLSLHYDPNRTAWIALVKAGSGATSAILLSEGVKVGDTLLGAAKTKLQPGNRMQVGAIPTGVEICDLELYPGQGGALIKSAGSFGTLVAKDKNYVQIRLPSKEVRKINADCYATIGRVSNATHSKIRIGKAGRVRLMGRRPHVRGKAMNPVSHPHGGGEGVNPIGLKHPKTPWGKPALGYITRRNRRTSKLIVRARPRGK